jgi:hypothetical protein
VEEFYVDTATLTREVGLVAVTRGIDLDTADWVGSPRSRVSGNRRAE